MGNHNSVLVNRKAEQDELISLIASEELTPGEFVDFGGSDDVQLVSTAGGRPTGMIVREQGGFQKPLSETWPSGDSAEIIKPRSGDLLYPFLADGEDVSRGDYGEFNASGHLQKQEAEVNATASVDVSSTGEKSVSIAHGLTDRTPSIDEVQLSIQEDDDISDYELDYVHVAAVDDTNIDIEVGVGTASGTQDASVIAQAFVPRSGYPIVQFNEALNNTSGSPSRIEARYL